LLQIWVIALFAAVALRDGIEAPVADGWLGPGAVAIATLVPLAVVAIGMWAGVRLASRRLDATGSHPAVIAADRLIAASRWLTVFLFAQGVLALGWLDVVRGAIGNLVVVDEAIAIAPALAVFVLGWVAIYPIERSLREASQVRQLDEGQPYYPVPSRGEFVSLNVRHGLMLTLAPMLLILALVEAVNWAITWLAGQAGAGGFPGLVAEFLVDDQQRELVASGAQLAGVLVIFLVAPALMRLVWDTVRLPAGELRDRLMELCRRHGVRIRDVLVWRTHGSMMNGAVLGFVPALRYVLLTDALLESLPEGQVEAVMAHEVAHVRHRHMQWLAVTLIGAVGILGAAGAIAMGVLSIPEDDVTMVAAAQLAVAIGSLAGGVVALGFVSRRFEWQADAFAAQHLSAGGGTARQWTVDSGQWTSEEAGSGRITPEAVTAMAGALGAVARLNHIPPNKFTLRHGSIADRQRRLLRLVGAPVDRLPIDASVGIIKRAAGAVFAAMLALTAWQIIAEL
jgi:Zn-dependent protease with chaperone function